MLSLYSGLRTKVQMAGITKRVLNFSACAILGSLFFGETVGGHEILVKNNCKDSIWVGTYGDNEIPANGGFFLKANGDSRRFPVRNNWLGGRVWARTGCNSQGTNCKTGDCGKAQCTSRTTFDAVTLAEFGLDNTAEPWYKDKDFWDISYVDGFNVPVTITPIAGTVKNEGNCQAVSCGFNMAKCPKANRVPLKAGSKQMGCKSQCSLTREEQYCCPGPKYDRNSCPQNKQMSPPVKLFKDQCNNACAWAFDDEQPIRSCFSSSSGSSSYEVTFC